MNLKHKCWVFIDGINYNILVKYCILKALNYLQEV